MKPLRLHVHTLYGMTSKFPQQSVGRTYQVCSATRLQPNAALQVVGSQEDGVPSGL